MKYVECLNGIKFTKYNTTCEVINYDYNSGKYLYKILIDNSIGYVSKEEIFNNRIN